VRTPYLDGRETYQLWRCDTCDHQWCTGDTSDDLLNRIYSGTFHQTAQQSGDVASSPIVANAKVRADWLTRELDLTGKLLDVGAGNGHFVQQASLAGFDSQGIELSDEAAETARAMGANVTTRDYMSDELTAGQFDVVTMWDVLCGFADPVGAVERAKALLRPGGAFVFTVADAGSRMARWSGRYWPLLIPPVNLHYFTRESVDRLLGEHGFEMQRFEHHGKRLSVRFVWQKALRTLRVSPLETRFAKFIPLSWRIRLNLGDIATVVAVRKTG
jgi:SAM-dependent methyltransferase